MNILKKSFYKARVLRHQIQYRRLLSELKTKKGYQKTYFNSLLNEFLSNFKKINQNLNQYTTQTWDNYTAELESVLLPHPPFSFLRNPTIMTSMVMTAGGRILRDEISFIEGELPRNKLIHYLEEDYVGDPLLVNSTYLTSHNSIHQLYHFIKFIKTTGADLNKINTVVDWGGGYGNMAKIFQRLKDTPSTYIIIDLPIITCLQWLYLSSIFKKENVHLLLNKEGCFQDEKINLLPISLLEYFEINSDLFVSTWALSETPSFLQDCVFFHQWFNAKRLLLAYGNDMLCDRLGAEAVKCGAVIEDIEFCPGSHYAFR